MLDKRAYRELTQYGGWRGGVAYLIRTWVCRELRDRNCGN